MVLRVKIISSAEAASLIPIFRLEIIELITYVVNRFYEAKCINSQYFYMICGTQKRRPRVRAALAVCLGHILLFRVYSADYPVGGPAREELCKHGRALICRAHGDERP